MIPLRFVGQELGYHVEWSKADSSIYIETKEDAKSQNENNINNYNTTYLPKISEIMNLGYTREDAVKRIDETDAEREKYYYQHTGKIWGDVSDYHIILDTSKWGIENCADVLMRYFERMQYI